MLRLLMRRRIPKVHLAIASVFGLFGGMYIWKPAFEAMQKEKSEHAVAGGSDSGGQ
jgi:hypothetical protein